MSSCFGTDSCCCVDSHGKVTHDWGKMEKAWAAKLAKESPKGMLHRDARQFNSRSKKLNKRQGTKLAKKNN